MYWASAFRTNRRNCLFRVVESIVEQPHIDNRIANGAAESHHRPVERRDRLFAGVGNAGANALYVVLIYERKFPVSAAAEVVHIVAEPHAERLFPRHNDDPHFEPAEELTDEVEDAVHAFGSFARAILRTISEVWIEPARTSIVRVA